jgi:predicted nucleotidyltransferase component of viral defense system
MIDRTELGRFGPPGFHLGQKEKDYVQHWVLSFLSRSGFGGAFKGGTCLQKAFGLPRFSDDLDFTLGGAGEPDYESLSTFLSSAGFAVVSWKKEEGEENALTGRIRYRGPLYSGSTITEGVLTLQLSKREGLVLAPRAAIIRPPYPDLLPYQLLAMDVSEIAAEKVRALLTRVSARDLFDLYFLLRLGAVLRKDLIEEKLSFYWMSLDPGQVRERLSEVKRVWKGEITALTQASVDYEEAAETFLKEMSRCCQDWTTHSSKHSPSHRKDQRDAAHPS